MRRFLDLVTGTAVMVGCFSACAIDSPTVVPFIVCIISAVIAMGCCLIRERL